MSLSIPPSLRAFALVSLSLLLVACSQPTAVSQTSAHVAPQAPAPADATPLPVALDDTQALTVHDPAGRDYPVWVSLPASYAESPDRRYPVLYVTDALYSFPLVRSVRNLVGQRGVNIEDFILVGLSPQQGLTSKQSRSRDYTPTAPDTSDPDHYDDALVYGGAAHYRDFLAGQVLPMIDTRYRTDPARRAFAGHSYGGLFGAYVLVTRPQLFHSYILSSPSLWYDDHAIDRFEADYAKAHRALDARVLLSVGSFEAVKPGPRYFRNNDMLAHNRSFAQTLHARGYAGLQVETDVVDGEDHFTVYPTMITRALVKLFPGKGPYSSG